MDFFIFDLIILAAAYTLSCFMRYDFNIPENRSSLFIRSGIALLTIYIFVAFVGENYRDILQRNKWVELGKVLAQIVISFAAFILYLYIIKENDFSRQIYIISAIIAFVIIWCWRVFWKHIIRRGMAKNDSLPYLLVISEKKNVCDFVKTISAKQYDYFRLKGVVIWQSEMSEEETDCYNDIEVGTVPIVCAQGELKSYLLENVIDEVFISIDDELMQRDIIDYCLEMGITVHIGLASLMMNFPSVTLGNLGGNAVLTTSNNFAYDWKLIIKRFVDILGGLAGCLVMLVMYVVVAPKIKKADPGPVFFVQNRVGKNGRHFKMFKFRSMYLDAEQRKAELVSANKMTGHIFKMDDDPRILPGIGKKIRESSVDEWPQFINVLKGDMSLVGTRPPTVDEFEQSEPHHKARLSFRPGVTGLWQVSGRNRVTDFEEIVALDNKYIMEWSIKLDAKIILKTLKVVAAHDGAE